MSVISLITDFGLSDNFAGVMKAVILQINPQVKIVDICHQVKPQDVRQAAFLLSSSFRFFPPKTVHLVVVDPGVGSRRRKIIVRTKDYYFVAPDNGVLAPVLRDEPLKEIIEITNERYFLKPVSCTFHGRDIFAPISAYLSKGESPAKFGRAVKSFRPLDLPAVKINRRELSGEIIHIDGFGNLISNIDKSTLESFIKNKRFSIRLKNNTLRRISRSYVEETAGKPLALIGSFGCLEIAVNAGSARDYLKASKGDKIRVIRE
jgi:hypothetical protein